jgi:serine kinase of HPr protein (carbohydrate metabolism regulator)
MHRLHGTCIAIEGSGVLLRGASGSGKSDLGLRLIDAGGELIADDYTDVVNVDGQLVASSPTTIRGLVEVRGVGVLRIPYRDSGRLVTAFELVAPEYIDRMPHAASLTVLEVALPLFRLAPFEASAVAKVHWIVRMIRGSVTLAQDT